MALRKWTFITDSEDAELRLDQVIAKRTDLSRRRYQADPQGSQM